MGYSRWKGPPLLGKCPDNAWECLADGFDGLTANPRVQADCLTWSTFYLILSSKERGDLLTWRFSHMLLESSGFQLKRALVVPFLEGLRMVSGWWRDIEGMRDERYLLTCTSIPFLLKKPQVQQWNHLTKLVFIFLRWVLLPGTYTTNKEQGNVVQRSVVLKVNPDTICWLRRSCGELLKQKLSKIKK